MGKVLILFAVLLSSFTLLRIVRRSQLSIKPKPVQNIEQTPTGTNQRNKLSTTNPFGVMISGNNTQIKIQSAKNLGAVYYRPLSVFIDKWNGSRLISYYLLKILLLITGKVSVCI